MGAQRAILVPRAARSFAALDRLRREDGFMGLVINGKRFDIGLPDYYLETLRTFREE